MSINLDRYRRRVGWIGQTRQLRERQEWINRNRVAAQAQISLFQDKIRDLLDQIGVYADLRHQYMAYAHALDKSQRELAFLVDLIRERQILRYRFENRGLEVPVLDAIDQLVIYRTGDL